MVDGFFFCFSGFNPVKRYIILEFFVYNVLGVRAESIKSIATASWVHGLFLSSSLNRSKRSSTLTEEVRMKFPTEWADFLVLTHYPSLLKWHKETYLQNRSRLTGISKSNLWLPKGKCGKWEWSPQSCQTLCNTMDCSPPGSSVRGIFQVRILEWVAISFSRRSSWPRDWTCVSRIVDRRLTIWTTREMCGGDKFGPWNKHTHTTTFKIHNQ